MTIRRLREKVRETVRRWPGETAVAIATVLGWLLLTWAAADVFGGVAWKAGTGLLLLGGVGFGFLGEVAREGLYVLTVTEETEDQRPTEPR